MPRVTVTVAPRAGRLLAPIGLATPHLIPRGMDVEGGAWRLIFCAATGQAAALIEPEGPVTVRYEFAAGAAPEFDEIEFIDALRGRRRDGS